MEDAVRPQGRLCFVESMPRAIIRGGAVGFLQRNHGKLSFLIALWIVGAAGCV
jgi:hypothetical protein